MILCREDPLLFRWSCPLLFFFPSVTGLYVYVSQLSLGMFLWKFLKLWAPKKRTCRWTRTTKLGGWVVLEGPYRALVAFRKNYFRFGNYGSLKKIRFFHFSAKWRTFLKIFLYRSVAVLNPHRWYGAFRKFHFRFGGQPPPKWKKIQIDRKIFPLVRFFSNCARTSIQMSLSVDQNLGKIWRTDSEKMNFFVFFSKNAENTEKW